MKSGWEYIEENEQREKLAPYTLAENVRMSENGQALLPALQEMFYPVGCIKAVPFEIGDGDWDSGVQYSYELTVQDAKPGMYPIVNLSSTTSRNFGSDISVTV